MKKSIYFKNKTQLIEEFINKNDVEILEKKKGLVSKLFSSNKLEPDLYFHSGSLDEDSTEIAKNSKKIIVNSQAMWHQMRDKLKIDENSIKTIYPSFKPQELDSNDAKDKLLNELKVEDKNTKILLFTGTNLKSSGAKEFLEIISSLNSKDFIAIIAGSSKQIYNIKFQLSKYKIDKKLFFIEDFENPDLLFAAADIFILPTFVESFSINVLKAMYYKCAVFLSALNTAREIVDVFATMQDPNDGSTPFKVDALLSREEDLILIQNQNHDTSLNFTFENQYEMIEDFAKNL